MKHVQRYTYNINKNAQYRLTIEVNKPIKSLVPRRVIHSEDSVKVDETGIYWKNNLLTTPTVYIHCPKPTDVQMMEFAQLFDDNWIDRTHVQISVQFLGINITRTLITLDDEPTTFKVNLSFQDILDAVEVSDNSTYTLEGKDDFVLKRGYITAEYNRELRQVEFVNKNGFFNCNLYDVDEHEVPLYVDFFYNLVNICTR